MIHIVPLDFLGPKGNEAMVTPANAELHDKVVAFCQRELANEVNLTHLAKVWVAVRDDGEVDGVFGYVLVPDVPLCRATSEEALRKLAERYNDFLADNGALGKTTFIYVMRGEKPECQCPGVRKVLNDWDAKLADRVEVKVR